MMNGKSKDPTLSADPDSAPGVSLNLYALLILILIAIPLETCFFFFAN